MIYKEYKQCNAHSCAKDRNENERSISEEQILKIKIIYMLYICYMYVIWMLYVCYIYVICYVIYLLYICYIYIIYMLHICYIYVTYICYIL